MGCGLRYTATSHRAVTLYGGVLNAAKEYTFTALNTDRMDATLQMDSGCRARTVGRKWTVNKMIARRIHAMHKRFGTCGVFRCKDCDHLLRNRPTSRICYKCELYGDTSSEATDWRLSNQACGMYNMHVDMNQWVPVFELVKHEPNGPQPPLEGQVDFSSILSKRG